MLYCTADSMPMLLMAWPCCLQTVLCCCCAVLSCAVPLMACPCCLLAVPVSAGTSLSHDLWCAMPCRGIPALFSHATCLWVHAPAHHTLNQQLCWNLQRQKTGTYVNLMTVLTGVLEWLQECVLSRHAHPAHVCCLHQVPMHICCPQQAPTLLFSANS